MVRESYASTQQRLRRISEISRSLGRPIEISRQREAAPQRRAAINEDKVE